MKVAGPGLGDRVLTTLGFGGVSRTGWILLGGNLFNAIGLGIIYPVLPLFVVQRGGSYLLVGVVAAAALAGNVLAQVPAGWLADRIDRRLIAVVSLALDGAGFAVYLIPMPVESLVVVRFLHAAVGGFYQPAARALLADLTPYERRGSIYGLWQSSTMGGYLIGPVVGGLIGLFSLELVFVGSAAVGLAASWVMTTLPRRIRPVEAEASGRRMAFDGRLLVALIPAIILGGAWQYFAGVYATIWVLYITALGGSTLVAGLTITLYTIPLIVLGGAAGALSDRFGARLVVFTSLLFCSIFAVLYATTRSIPLVIVLQFTEAFLTVGGMPAILAEVSRAAPPSMQGRAQGLFNLFTLGAEGAGSLGGGFLFGYGLYFPILSGAAVCLVAIAAVPFLGRNVPAVRHAALE